MKVDPRYWSYGYSNAMMKLGEDLCDVESLGFGICLASALKTLNHVVRFEFDEPDYDTVKTQQAETWETLEHVEIYDLISALQDTLAEVLEKQPNSQIRQVLKALAETCRIEW